MQPIFWIEKSQLSLVARKYSSSCLCATTSQCCQFHSVTVIDDDYDVELPTPYEIDFPCGVHSRDPTATEFMPKILLDAIADVREKRRVYSSFVSNCILGRILGKVLGILNSPAALRTSRATDPQATMEIEKELAEWSKIMSYVVNDNGRIEVEATGNENGERK